MLTVAFELIWNKVEAWLLLPFHLFLSLSSVLEYKYHSFRPSKNTNIQPYKSVINIAEAMWTSGEKKKEQNNAAIYDAR